MRVKSRQSCLPYSFCSRFGGHGKIGCACALTLFCSEVGVQRRADYYFRSWVLILGMSGLIVLFWFVGEGVALRYFVSIEFSNLSRPCSYFFFFSSSGTLYRGHVMLVLLMGCDR
jgi:hypothetical protein